MLLPCESGEYAAVAVGDDDPASSERPGPWVLLIDDDPVAARSIARWVGRVSRMGVRTVHSAEQAERELNEHPDPMAIVTDFELAHGETGVGALIRLRRRGCTAPAALLTGAPERALEVLTASSLTEVVPVFSKTENGSRLWEWLDQLRLCFAESA